MNSKRIGILAFEDGSVYKGVSFGAISTVCGEVVFNTSMIGYESVLTDSSYYGQIVTMTAVEIGNYGIATADEESDGAKVRGLIIRNLSPISSNWRSEMTLDEYLKKNGVPAIMGLDTRAITRKLRSGGTMKACLSTEVISDDEAIAKARACDVGVNFVKEVTTKKERHFDVSKEDVEPFTVEGTNLYKFKQREPRLRCAVIDYGVKASTLKNLSGNGFDVTIFPADVSAEKVMEFNPECIFLSSGPGDPSLLKEVHANVGKLVKRYPTIGIGLGHEIVGCALGAKAYKLKLGHRGGNHPVKNVDSGVVSITSQNHGYAIDRETLEGVGGIVTEVNMNDGSVEGMMHKEYPIYTVQYYPEVGAGAKGIASVFENFYYFVKKHT